MDYFSFYTDLYFNLGIRVFLLLQILLRESVLRAHGRENVKRKMWSALTLREPKLPCLAKSSEVKLNYKFPLYLLPGKLCRAQLYLTISITTIIIQLRNTNNCPSETVINILYFYYSDVKLLRMGHSFIVMHILYLWFANWIPWKWDSNCYWCEGNSK